MIRLEHSGGVATCGYVRDMDAGHKRLKDAKKPCDGREEIRDSASLSTSGTGGRGGGHSRHLPGSG